MHEHLLQPLLVLSGAARPTDHVSTADHLRRATVIIIIIIITPTTVRVALYCDQLHIIIPIAQHDLLVSDTRVVSVGVYKTEMPLLLGQQVASGWWIREKAAPAAGHGAIAAQEHVAVLLRRARVLEIGLALVDHNEYARVDKDHDEAREEEGAERGVDPVGEEQIESARVALAAFLLFPAENGRQADEHADQPDERDHGPGQLGRALPRVGQGSSDREVAVERDAAQVENGRRAEHHVRADPKVARHMAEYPLVVHDHVDGDGHDENAHEHVRHAQRHDERVGDGVERAGGEHGQNNQQVAGQSDQADGEHDQRDHDSIDEREARRQEQYVLC